MKKGQITVFIIIGIVLLFLVGTVLYITGREERQEFELARPRVAKLPERIQPVRDSVETCVSQLLADGLKLIGDSGGYVDHSKLLANPYFPTEGEAVKFSDGGPVVAYWWFMKDKNSCEAGCRFDTKRPPLSRREGAGSVEAQLDEHISKNLRACLGRFDFPGCTVQEVDEPKMTATVGADNVVVLGKFHLRVTCEDQTVDVDDYYASVDLNLREIYNLGTAITNHEKESLILEQATKNIINTFSGVDSRRLPPVRALDFGPPEPGTYWIKFDVKGKLQRLLMSYVPLIQVFGVRNYNYIAAPGGVADPELYELLYNRQFLLPLNESHPTLEARFSYLDWWEPYFDLNCNGQLCQADSGTNFFLLPFAINRYEFAYDVSYPVLVEIRNPFAFNGAGYSFKFFLEQNLRNSEGFTTDTKLLPAAEPENPPSIFCEPGQRTSGDVQLYARDAETQRGVNDASVSFICGDQNCNLGLTSNGTFLSAFPRCVGGALRVTKPGFASFTRSLDTMREAGQNISVTLEPVRTVKVTVKNLPVTKESKLSPWKFEQATGLLRPKAAQQTVVMLTREASPFEEPFTAVADVQGAGTGEMNIIPGRYRINIISLLRENVVIPPDERCFNIKKMFSSKKKCQMVPEKPVVFNSTSPFPYGTLEFEYEFTSQELRNAKGVEFRVYVLAIDKVPEEDRVVEDLSELSKLELYAQSDQILIYPVVTK